MPREDGETASMRIARAARLLALAGYDLEHEKALLLLADMNMFRSYGQARNTTSAFKHYSHLAHQHGNPVGQRYVGLMYASGIGVKRDYAKALVYLNFAAMGQDVIAEQTLGYWYSTGIGVAKSCDDAVFFYRAAADKAINLYKSGPPFGLAMPPSKQRLPDEQGGIYGPGASGPGHQQAPQNSVSPETMKEIFEVQAEDDVAVQVHLGRAYYDGTPPFTRDFRKAMKYFKMAARAYTGVKLPAGAEVSGSLKTKMIYAGDPKKALEYFTRAIPAHIMALYRLGEMYSKGIGTSANCLLGVGYLKSVSEKGDWHDDTIRKAESLYRRGDRESALLHYLLAGERGIEVAQSNAAWMVESRAYRVFGRENVDPYEVAIVLWNRAANQGNVDGRVKVGDYYFHGLGRRNGTESGSVSTGGDKSATGAEHLKTQVYEKTTSILGVIREWMAETSLLPGGAPGKPDYRMAAMYYQVASDEHSALAQWNLGYMHENGLGVEKDFPLAKRMYDMALSTNMDAYLPLVADLVTGRLFRTILDKVVSLSVALLQTELGALAGDHVHDILPILGDEDEAGDAAAGVAGDLFDMTGPYAPLVKNLMKAWSGVWFELVLVSGLAALASVLFLWRQLISAADDAARRAAAVAAAAAADEAARRAAAAARPAPVPAPAPTAAVPTPSVPPTATTASAVGSEKNGADPVETESIGDSEMRHRTNTKAEGEA
ncbi:hypothetical protein BC829DRAFT_397442 [Chytridium lagenaria]|nr:hypothetical protein BC829DRAFT_397442 [Chytridium lagenaria]